MLCCKVSIEACGSEEFKDNVRIIFKRIKSSVIQNNSHSFKGKTVVLYPSGWAYEEGFSGPGADTAMALATRP